MIHPRRLLIATLTLLFGALNVSFALFELDHFNHTWTVVSLGLVYFITLTATVLGFRSLALPIWISWIAILVAVTIPIVSHLSLVTSKIQGKDTWYVTAIALLLSVLAVRGRIIFAIVGGVVFISEAIYFAGLDYLPKSGITGAVMLVGVSIAISRGLESSEKNIEDTQAILRAKRERTQFRESVIVESEVAFRNFQKAVLPTLRRAASGNHFSKADKFAYQLLEIELRDVISGRRLVNARMKRAVQKARERGVDVALLDEGGLENTKQDQLDELLDLVVSALSQINTGRVTIRTQPEESWLIRMTASRPRVVTPDLDLKLGKR